MSKSKYVENLRKKIGSDLLLVPGVAAIIRDPQGRILVQRNKDGIWNLPAGAIDPGEKPAQAIVREVFEETGLSIRPSRVLGVIGGQPEYRQTYPNGDIIESTTIVFECKVVGGEVRPKDDETSNLQYFAIDEMPELVVPYPRDIFSDRAGGTFFEWKEDWINPPR
jgi:8-oxo-dGTP pyrophosphatase MutT (NUDIX family)